MALQVYGDISRTAGHAHETIAISRLGASRIRHGLGHLFDAGRHAWNAHKHAINGCSPYGHSKRGPCFSTWRLATNQQTLHRCTSKWRKRKPSILRMNRQRLQSTPMTSTASSTGAWNTSKKAGAASERPAVRAMLTLAHRLEKMERFATLMASPEQVRARSDVGRSGPSVFIHTRRNGGVGQTLGRTHDALIGHSGISGLQK